MKEKANTAFNDADANKDGALSLDEFLVRHKEKFNEIDTDKSGSLTQDEMKAHGAEKRERWKEHREERKDKMMDKGPDDAPKTETAPAQ
jgi:Ca2+-binding EF-hand superfamily protein